VLNSDLPSCEKWLRFTQSTTPDVKTAGIQYACCFLVTALFSLALDFEFKFLETQDS